MTRFFMRVPPEVLSGPTNWHFPITTVILALSVIVTGVVAGFDPTAVATQSNRISKLEVLVAKQDLEVGALITSENVTLSVLPVQQVSGDVLRAVKEVLGARAGTHIPRGMPIAPALLGPPDEVEEQERLQRQG